MKTKQSARSTRLNARLQRLREHHDKCLCKYMEYINHQVQPAGSPNQEEETSSTSSSPSPVLTLSSLSSLSSIPSPPSSPSSPSPPSSPSSLSSPSLSSASEVSSETPVDFESNTEIRTPKSSHSDASDDPDVPPLRRTDSICLTKEHLEQMSEVSDGSEATQTCATDVVVGSSRSKRRWRAESNSGDPKTGSSTPKRRQKTVESDSDNPKTETPKRRSWLPEEVQAVEKTLMAFIEAGKVPRKSECVACITTSPEALKKRSWTAVKYYVKTRITEIQRESARKTN